MTKPTKADGLARAYQEVVKQRGELREQLKTERERARREKVIRKKLDTLCRIMHPAWNERAHRRHDPGCPRCLTLAAVEALDKEKE